MPKTRNLQCSKRLKLVILAKKTEKKCGRQQFLANIGMFCVRLRHLFVWHIAHINKTDKLHVLASIVTIYTRKVKVGLLLIFPLMLSHSGRWKAIFWKSSYQSLPCVDTPRNIWPPFSLTCCKYISKLSSCRGTKSGCAIGARKENLSLPGRLHSSVRNVQINQNSLAEALFLPTGLPGPWALERRLKGRIRTDIRRLYNLQC